MSWRVREARAAGPVDTGQYRDYTRPAQPLGTISSSIAARQRIVVQEAQTADRRLWASILIAMLVGVPAVVLRVSGVHLEPVLTSLIYGVGIVAGAFLLSWAAEAAQLDVSAICTY